MPEVGCIPQGVVNVLEISMSPDGFQIQRNSPKASIDIRHAGWRKDKTFKKVTPGAVTAL